MFAQFFYDFQFFCFFLLNSYRNQMNLQKNIKMFFKTKKVLLITYSKIFKTWILLYKNDFYKEITFATTTRTTPFLTLFYYRNVSVKRAGTIYNFILHFTCVPTREIHLWDICMIILRHLVSVEYFKWYIWIQFDHGFLLSGMTALVVYLLMYCFGDVPL